MCGHRMWLANSGVRMTKLALLLGMGLSALSVPAIAQHAGPGGFAPMVGASDPCVLGMNAQPGACVGAVRVAPMIISQGPVQLQPAFQAQPAYAPVQAYEPVQTYVPQQTGYAQPSLMVPIGPTPIQISGCVPGYSGPNVTCNGAWVPVNQYTPACYNAASTPIHPSTDCLCTPTPTDRSDSDQFLHRRYHLWCWLPDRDNFHFWWRWIWL
jgi:hypothetical protein